VEGVLWWWVRRRGSGFGRWLEAPIIKESVLGERGLRWVSLERSSFLLVLDLVNKM